MRFKWLANHQYATKYIANYAYGYCANSTFYT